ncbi:MAG TPA: nucleoside hydrolase [Planctomycetota bacterium]|jgi:hypothetical protein
MKRMIAVVALLAVAAMAGDKVPVIHCTDLYHPHEDPDDHFDLATMYAIPEVEVKAIILDKGSRQEKAPGRIPVSQMNKITGRDVPCAIGLAKNLSKPDDKVLDDKAEYQQGVELILKVLKDSPRPVSIVTLGSCRDVAAAYNREPELLRSKIGKLMIFIGEADEAKQNYREYNVDLDRNAYICVMRSGLPVYWVPCMDGGAMKNNGKASFWRAKHSDVLSGSASEVVQFFIYALEKKSPATEEPLAFLSKPVGEAERTRLFKGVRNLWCASVFESLVGKEIVRSGEKWAAAPAGVAPASVPAGSKPVFGFSEAEVAISDDAATSYAKTATSRKVMRFEVLDKENYAAAMTAVTAELIGSLGKK